MSSHNAAQNGTSDKHAHLKKGVYGSGSYTDTKFIPLPEDCRRILEYLAKVTPGFTKDAKALADVHFHGNDLPILPGPIKAQALAAVIHAMIGIVSKEILAMKGIDPGKISIDIDKAGMYPASAFLVAFNGKTLPAMAADGSMFKVGTDLGEINKYEEGPMKFRGWSIYPTKDKNVYYQIMTNMEPKSWFAAFNIDPKTPVKSLDEAYEVIKKEIVKYSAAELELKNIEHGFCGSICYSPKAWNETLMGKTLARHPLLNYRKVKTTEDLPPVPFPNTPNDKRPLAGIRVVELARVIAAPALGAVLTSLGAEVVKVESPDKPDPHALQMSLTVGKYTCGLDLTNEADRQRLHKLLDGADVIVQAFRRRSLQRKGFGLEDLLDTAKKRNKGIVYLDLSCYGPDGTYAERPGYQQIADCATGCAYVLGKAYGFEEGVSVLPCFPIADMLTGATGAIDVLLALRDRAKSGGSYHADVALCATDAIQLTPEFGLYPPEVVKTLQDTYQFKKMTPDLHVEELLRDMVETWTAQTDLMDRKEYFVHFAESAFGKDHILLGPIVKFDDKEASPHWTKPPEPYLYHKEVGWSH